MIDVLVQKIEPELYFLQVRFGPDEAFYLLNRKGDKLRTISIKNIETLVVDVTQDTNGHRGGSGKKPMALVRVNKEHDLVLEFGYPGERKKFLAKLENFLSVILLLLLPADFELSLSHKILELSNLGLERMILGYCKCSWLSLV